MSEYLTLAHHLSTPTVGLGTQPQLIYLVLEVDSGETAPARRLPLNLGLVVDVSRSMRIPIVDEEQFERLARKGHVREVMVDGLPVWEVQHVPDALAAELPTSLGFVQQALKQVAERLQAADRVALVAFAAEAQTLQPSTVGRLQARTLAALDALDLGDETIMAPGLVQGLQEVQRGHSVERVNRILLLTDGLALDEGECQVLARQAQERRIAITTLGLGVEFNEELLIALAEISGGHAYFARQPQQVPDLFAQEFERAEAVAYRDLELKLLLTPGVELRRAFRVRPSIADLSDVPSEGGSANLFLGDLEAGDSPAVLLELVVPPRPAGVYRLCQVVLAYDDPVTAASQVRPKVRQDVLVQYSADPADLAAGPNPTVMNVVERVTAFRLQMQALEQAATGDLAGATVKLRAAATRLLDMGETALAQATLREAEGLEQKGQISAENRKELRYATRRLT